LGGTPEEGGNVKMSANFAYLNARDLKFIVKEWLPTEQVFKYPKFSIIIPKKMLTLFWILA
jgi:hypothetical protein